MLKGWIDLASNILLYVLGFFLASIITRIILYKIVHPYLVVPYLLKKRNDGKNIKIEK